MWKLDGDSIGFVKRDREKFGFMSNFYPCSIKYCGKLFKSVEHAYQWSKTDDLEWKIKIEHTKTPSEAKKIGGSLPLKENWNVIKIDIMRDLLKIKFSDNALKFKLLKTGSKTLIEDATWDSFWGCGSDLNGQNNLGKLLMELRLNLCQN